MGVRFRFALLRAVGICSDETREKMSAVSAWPNTPRDTNRAFNRGIRSGDCIDACGLSAFVSDSASHLMKIRRSVLLCALVAILIFFSGSASAEDSPRGR